MVINVKAASFPTEAAFFRTINRKEVVKHEYLYTWLVGERNQLNLFCLVYDPFNHTILKIIEGLLHKLLRGAAHGKV